MPMVVDPEKLEAALAEVIQRQQPYLAAPGYQGVLARMQSTVMPVLTRWRAAECNRPGADPNDIANALVGLFATAIASEIQAVLGNEIGEAHYNLANMFFQGIGEEVGALLSGNHPTCIKQAVGPSPAGMA